jgi:hypothetical protein
MKCSARDDVQLEPSNAAPAGAPDVRPSPPGPTVGDMGEHLLIERIRARVPPAPQNFVPIANCFS